MLYFINTILYFVLILPTVLASNERCTNINGICTDNAIEKCKGNYTYTKNRCDGDESIKCCIPVITCNTPDSTGVCINVEQCDTNTSKPVTNYCPDLPDDIKCCVPKSKNSNKVNKVMDVDTFINKLKDVEKNYNTRYVLGGLGEPLTKSNKDRFANDNNNIEKYWRDEIIKAPDDSFAFDCSGLIKSILWGWNGDRSKSRGGAVYKPDSNNVPDATADSLCSEKHSTNMSSDFSNIERGEIVCMYEKGTKVGHIGVYIGDNKVIESTPAHITKDYGGVQETDVSKRIGKDNKNKGIWDFHKHFNFIDYNINKECFCSASISSHTMITDISKDSNLVNSETCNCDANNNNNISDNNLNSNGDSENPKNEDSGASNFKQFSFFSIFLIFTTILIWQTHILF